MRLRWHRVSVHRYAISRFLYERATINARLSPRYIGAMVTIDGENRYAIVNPAVNPAFG